MVKGREKKGNSSEDKRER